LGGELQVSFENNNNQFENIWLIGPTEKVFEGEIVI
jgi:diaminopimelate epimerase